VTSLALVELFEIDLTPWSGGILRFHAGKNALGEDVVFDGQTYLALPIQAEGFEHASGQAPRPKLRLANVTGAITGYILDYDEILGAKVTRRRTLAKYLDAVNFAAGNPDADPDAQFPPEVWFVERRAMETKLLVEFDLSASYDVASVSLPGRQIIANVCPAIYRDATTGCSWSPDPETGPFFDADDEATTAGNDRCSHRLTGCRARFGQNGELPYMGFPASGLIR
jgi:lambda family phage minor tail protein L